MTVRQFAIIATIWLVILSAIVMFQQIQLNNLIEQNLHKQICIQELIPLEPIVEQ